MARDPASRGATNECGPGGSWPMIPHDMHSHPDQQPVGRTVGRRISREGRPLTPADRAAMTRMAQYVTRAPKGVYRYRSQAEMDADRLRWTVDAVVARTVR